MSAIVLSEIFPELSSWGGSQPQPRNSGPPCCPPALSQTFRDNHAISADQLTLLLAAPTPAAGPPAPPMSRTAVIFPPAAPLAFSPSTSQPLTSRQQERVKEILHQLRTYEITVVTDWGGEITIGGKELWHGETWEPHELEMVLQVVERFTEFSGSPEATRRALGGVTLQQVSHIGGGQHIAPLGLIQISDNLFHQDGPLIQQQFGPRVALAHELAHYWSWKDNDSWLLKLCGQPGHYVGRLPAAVGTEPGPTSWARDRGPVEDWAESVAGYLYPEYFEWLSERAEEQETGMIPGTDVHYPLPGLGPLHTAYIAEQFYALRNSTP